MTGGAPGPAGRSLASREEVEVGGELASSVSVIPSLRCLPYLCVGPSVDGGTAAASCRVAADRVRFHKRPSSAVAPRRAAKDMATARRVKL